MTTIRGSADHRRARMSDELRRTRRSIRALGMLLSVGALLALAARGRAAPFGGGTESLGEELLDDLDPNLFGPPESAQRDFEKRILPDLPDGVLGEDLGQPSAGGSLVRVQRNMLAAEGLLRQEDSLDRAGRVQDQVVADLDTLIEQLSKQCQ